jgi:hypothetical protein
LQFCYVFYTTFSLSPFCHVLECLAKYNVFRLYLASTKTVLKRHFTIKHKPESNQQLTAKTSSICVGQLDGWDPSNSHHLIFTHIGCENPILTIFVKYQQFVLPVNSNLVKFWNLLHTLQTSVHATILSLSAQIVKQEIYSDGLLDTWFLDRGNKQNYLCSTWLMNFISYKN